MITRIFEKLNNPIAVILILAAVVAVNGYLFYQQRSTPETTASNVSDETSTQPSGTGSEETTQPEEPSEAENNAPASGEQNEQAEQSSEDGPREDQAADGQNEGERNEAEQPSGGERSENEPSERSSDERNEAERNEAERNEAEQPSDDDASDDEPRDRSGGGDSQDEEEGGRGSRGEREGRTSGNGEEAAGRPPLAGLGDALEDCEGNRGECVRDFVSRVSPESRYIGGRTDLASGDSEQNAEILYFEDPGMEACQYERRRLNLEDGLDYTVILFGPGSFDDERGEECIPTT